MVPVARRSFSVEEYHRMMDAGILTEDDRVELIQGEILKMAPIGSRHAACVKRLNRLFSSIIGDRALVGVQDPIRIGHTSEPEPDVSLLTSSSDFYASTHPKPEDVLLLVEVSDTTGEYDRAVKVTLYATAGIREVWVVDLVDDRIDVFRNPVAGTYRTTFGIGRGETIHPELFPDLNLSADRILG